jgi:hypothetical protein
LIPVVNAGLFLFRNSQKHNLSFGAGWRDPRFRKEARPGIQT